MHKTLAIIIFVIAEVAYGSRSFTPQLNVFHHYGDKFDNQNVELDLCPTCINEAVELINVIANIILDEGVLGSCHALCDAVYNKTGSKVLQDLCTTGCDAIGIDELVKLIIAADIDPIYYCQLVHMCPIKDDGDAKFINFGVFPKSGPEGTIFSIDLSFKTVNGTGTGTFDFNIVDAKNQSTGDQYWFEEKKPGSYIERIKFQTFTIPHCDPSKTKGCEISSEVGAYNITARICNGICGSHHPHSSIYDSAVSSFNITKKQ